MDNRVDLQTIKWSKWSKIFMHSGQNRMRSMKIFSLIVSFLCAVSCCFIGQTYAVTLDSQGTKEPWLSVTNVGMTGHRFTEASDKRIYGFDVEYKLYPPDDVATNWYGGTEPFTAVWNSSTNHLTITCDNLGEAEYQCEHADPFLGDESPSHCTLTHFHGKQYWFESDLIGYLRNGCLDDMWAMIPPGQRWAMKLEALAKSMRPEPNSSENATPGATILMIHNASDVIPPEGWQVEFCVENEDDTKSDKNLYNLSGEKLSFPKPDILHPLNITVIKDLEPGFYSFYAKMRTSLTTTYDSRKIFFKVISSGTLGEPVSQPQQQEMSGTLALDIPILLSPAENQKFMSPAKVNVDFFHTLDKKIVTELQYAPFGKEKTDILLFKPLEYMATYQNDDNKIILTFTLKKNGIYRIRARYNDKGSKWTNWRRFKVDTYNKKLLSVVKSNQPKTDFAKTIKKPVERVLPKSPGQQHGVQIAKTKKQNISGVIAKNGINPQPEPPGKQLRSPDLPLQIMPVAHSYRAPAKVKIRVKNTPFSRIPFELGYRPGNGGAYQPVRRPQHTFARTNETTNLTISLKKAGQYRVRFRKNHKAPWTRWLSFQITENPAKTASPAQKIRISPSGARTINPQPEPPGKQVGIQAIRNHGRIQPETQPQLKLSRQLQQPPPAIKTPKNGQKFMLAGKSMHIKAEISHAAGQKIQVEVQYEKGRQFLPVKKGIRIHRMNDKTNVDMVISNTGTYRLKIKNSGKGSQWSKWTTFHVFKVMKNMPHPALKKPEIQPSTVPTIQLPAASLIK